MENKIRNNLNEIYFGKTRDIVNGLRSVVPLSESKQTQEFKVIKTYDIEIELRSLCSGSTEKCHITEERWSKLSKDFMIEIKVKAVIEGNVLWLNFNYQNFEGFSLFCFKRN